MSHEAMRHRSSSSWGRAGARACVGQQSTPNAHSDPDRFGADFVGMQRVSGLSVFVCRDASAPDDFATFRAPARARAPRTRRARPPSSGGRSRGSTTRAATTGGLRPARSNIGFGTREIASSGPNRPERVEDRLDPRRQCERFVEGRLGVVGAPARESLFAAPHGVVGRGREREEAPVRSGLVRDLALVSSAPRAPRRLRGARRKEPRARRVPPARNASRSGSS